uniref:Uncharacterized protein n=1 Tax=Arundo donax TaxID=35708 RepID=A0A0A9GM72_ARUDO
MMEIMLQKIKKGYFLHIYIWISLRCCCLASESLAKMDLYI